MMIQQSEDFRSLAIKAIQYIIKTEETLLVLIMNSCIMEICIQHDCSKEALTICYL
ncbi:hypothetical protein SDC9_140805 [bioreactor metagenome]|uniref:Uncharacterized protein n=1 Tax=bioreactor metagenome TaxID=1076179 RepID=A0A645DWI4_9ZZZZ